MNDPWRKYIGELVNLSKYKFGQDEQAQIRLCRADYHGALVKVSKAPNVSLLGIEGFVVMETRNTFHVISAENVLRRKMQASLSELATTFFQ